MNRRGRRGGSDRTFVICMLAGLALGTIYAHVFGDVYGVVYGVVFGSAVGLVLYYFRRRS